MQDDSQTEDGQITWVADDDYSKNDKIVRSFDQIVYTLQVYYISINQQSNKIMIEVDVPEKCYWDLGAIP